MNDSQIESLLRHPTRVVVPAGLKARLLNGIRLPRAATTADSAPRVTAAPSFWQRWFPALSLGMLLMGCFMVVAWQAGQWLSWRQENQTLRASLPDLDGLRSEQALLKKNLAATGPVGLDAAEQAELVRLRDESAQLSARAAEISALVAENGRLRAELAAAAAQAGVGPEADPFAEAQARAKRINCVNNLKQLGLALIMWADDHGDRFPMDFLSASNEMATPKILTCAGDSARVRAQSWQDFEGANVSYEYLAPGGTGSDPQAVLTRCPIHNNVGLWDGSVQMLSTNQHIDRAEGKWRIVNTNPQP